MRALLEEYGSLVIAIVGAGVAIYLLVNLPAMYQDYLTTNTTHVGFIQSITGADPNVTLLKP